VSASLSASPPVLVVVWVLVLVRAFVRGLGWV